MTLRSSHLGHTHFWARPISRRAFLGSAALAGGAALTSSVWFPELARADFDGLATVLPRPIPGGAKPLGIQVHHFPTSPLFGPTSINEPSEITDFNGIVGLCQVTGHGTGTDLATGATTRLSYKVDNGFMSGLYIGEDGAAHHGSFAFI
jgi:hypothetical protein